MKSSKSITINAILNTIRQICTILFPLITLPYASRVLQTDNYGKINFVTSYISYFSILSALGISTYAIREGAPIRAEKKKINEFVKQVFSINITSTVIAYLALLLSVFALEMLWDYKVLIFIYAISIALTTIGVEWVLSIYEDYIFITLQSIILQAVSLFCMFLFVKTKKDLYTYAIISVAANSGANIISTLYVRKYIKIRFTFNMNLKTHLKPLLILLCNTIAMVIYVNSDITILGFLTNDTNVGIYSVTVKIYTGIKQLLNAVLAVSIPRIVIYLDSKNKEKYNALLSKILVSLLIVLLPVMVGMFCLSDELIYIIAGEAYISGAIALRILSIALCFSIGAGFYANAILITNKLEVKVLKSTLIAAVMNVLLNFFLIKAWEQNGAAFTTMISELFVLIMCYFYANKLCNIYISRNDIVAIFIGIVFVGLVCLMCRILILNIYLRVITDIVLSILVYSAVQIFCKNDIFCYYLISFLNFKNKNRKN